MADRSTFARIGLLLLKEGDELMPMLEEDEEDEDSTLRGGGRCTMYGEVSTSPYNLRTVTY
jgi:hypothetical protein